MQEESKSATNQSRERELVSSWRGKTQRKGVFVLHNVIDMV